jgi:hypothetical protein
MIGIPKEVLLVYRGDEAHAAEVALREDDDLVFEALGAKWRPTGWRSTYTGPGRIGLYLTVECSKVVDAAVTSG